MTWKEKELVLYGCLVIHSHHRFALGSPRRWSFGSVFGEERGIVFFSHNERIDLTRGRSAEYQCP